MGNILYEIPFRVFSLLLLSHICSTMTVKIVVFAPANNSFGYCLERITPAMQIAQATITLPPFVELNLTYIDSKFPDETAVELAAIDFIWNKNVHGFIGPVYDYPLSHLARIAAAENLPLVTPGGLSRSFSADKTVYTKYKTLVRLGPTMNYFSAYLSWYIFQYLKYQHLKILTQKHGPLLEFCKIFHSAMDDHLNTLKNKHFLDIVFDLHQFPKKYDPGDLLRTEVNVNYTGKY